MTVVIIDLSDTRIMGTCGILVIIIFLSLSPVIHYNIVMAWLYILSIDSYVWL